METNYIKFPSTQQPITITKGKVPRVKPAKWEEVPEAYRSKRIAKRKEIMSNILLFFIGLADFIRKEVKV